MKLNYDRKSKDPKYFIQQGFRNGSKTSTRNVAVIGKHSELLAMGIEDPLAYAKEKVAEYNKNFAEGKVSTELKLDFNEKVKASSDVVSSSTLKNTGYFFLQAVYGQLKLGDFFSKVLQDRKISFDPDEVNRFLTYARILEPDSKLGTYDHLDRYYEAPSFGYQHIMRTLDVLEQNYDDYISHLYENSQNLIKRDTSVCYFDCTNYYFETESQDPDYVDEVTGEIIPGFQRYGPSKEHRPNPLVEMGLFMDANGIPISMCIAPGSESEQKLAIPLEKKLKKMLGGKKFIYCADAGLGSLNIRAFNSMGGSAFIITQSIKKLSEQMKTAVFNDCDFRLLSNDRPISIQLMKEFDHTLPENLPLYQDNAYKVIEAEHAYDIGLTEEITYKNGKKGTRKSKVILPQKLIVTFSRKMMEYQRHIRNGQITRAKELLKTIDPETYKKGPNDVTRLIKRTSKGKDGEKAVDQYVLNEERIAEEEKYDGWYAVATNLDDPAKDILEISGKRYQIEDCFRMMKTNFNARPVYHRSREHITAHFMVCFTALLVFRIMEAKLKKYANSLKESQHYTAQNIIDTLRNMNVAEVNDLYYTATYKGSQVLNALNAVWDLKLDKKNYLPKDLNKKIRSLL